MSVSLSSLVVNLVEGIYNNEFADWKSRLEYISTKDDLLIIF